MNRPAILAVAAAVLVSAASAAADTTPTDAPDVAMKKDAGGKDPKRLEFGVLPALTYDSDRGVGFGAIGTLARFHPGFRPYRWRLEFLVYATAKSSPDGGTELAYHDDYLILDQPGLLDNKLRVKSQVGFRRFSTSGYYGLGNATEELDDVDDRFYQYDRIYPFALSNGRFELWDRSTDEHTRRLEAFGGVGFWYNRINLYEGSLLEQHKALAEMDTPDGHVLDTLLDGTDDHNLLMFTGGLLFDTRDHEYAPTRGTFTELSVRASPGIDAGLTFAGASLITRWFQSLYGDRLVLAMRATGDVLFGSVPVYELAAVGGFTRDGAPGGGTSVRGVALSRFHGKIKVIGNVELRAQFLPFSIAGQRFNLGAVTYVDAGRVWADYEQVEFMGEKLDDALPNFAVGVGAGLRLRWGETFIVRADPGYSITEETLGIYISINHIF
ncbi:Omp85 family outer membrane protein [Haliangium sp.]|uniref:Omp85 family outer membrane protein n=1 Tax=Haliangium sp. TaxID=2663208 RepID=UPI003D0BB2AC